MKARKNDDLTYEYGYFDFIVDPKPHKSLIVTPLLSGMKITGPIFIKIYISNKF